MSVFIAPNFVNHRGGVGSRIWSRILTVAGIRFEHQWSGQEYLAWMEAHGWLAGVIQDGYSEKLIKACIKLFVDENVGEMFAE